MQRVMVPVFFIALSPLSNSSVCSELGRDGCWGCMEEILTEGCFDQGAHLPLPTTVSAGSLTLSIAG